LVLRPQSAPDELLAIGTAHTTDASLLPSSLLAALPRHGATRELVALGRYRFYRYRGVTPHDSGQVETLYVLPTTTGTVVAACVSDTAHATFTAACEHVVGTLMLDSGGPLALGPNRAYAAALKDTIGKLNSATHTAQARLLKARSANTQAVAARQLGAAYRQAAASLPVVGSDSIAQPAQAALHDALNVMSTRCAQLARAAARNDKRAYDAARASIARAQSTLDAALAQLDRFGYVARRGHT
jgi:hypothetical protein